MVRESSPYTWGVQPGGQSYMYHVGIIPIYMGSTLNGFFVGIPPTESSPYTWGVLNIEKYTTNFDRIIPIYMGSTLSQSLVNLK